MHHVNTSNTTLRPSRSRSRSRQEEVDRLLMAGKSSSAVKRQLRQERGGWVQPVVVMA